MHLKRRMEGKKGITSDQVMLPQETLTKAKRALFMYGPITILGPEGIRMDWFSPYMICDALLAMDEDSHAPIWLVIESPGGVVDSALCIYDTMKTLTSPVYTVVRQAASAAVTVAVGGAPGHRYIYPNAKMYIHQPSANFGTTRATEQKKAAKEMMDVYRRLAEILKENGAKPSIKKIMADMQEETWLTAKEAVAYGLVDRLVTKGEMWGNQSL